jgi:hypothetical protein
MKKRILVRVVASATAFLVSFGAFAATFYVATNGNDSNNGSSGSPFKTLSKAISTAASNDIIMVATGTYTVSAKITISKTLTIKGTFTSAATRPVLDFAKTSATSTGQGIALTGNNSTIYGLQIKRAGDNGMQVTGDNNTIEFCSFFENFDSGLQLDGGASGNKVINCDSYYNADPDMGDADGFACKLDVGQNNSFDGCRAWNNSDDGWDGYLRGANNINTTIKNSWAMKNGYLKNGSASDGNGSGFKMGGSDNKDLSHNQTLTNCFAFLNRRRGFHANNNTGSMTLLNCTAYGDKVGDAGEILYMLPLALASGKTQTLKNCVAFGAATATQLIAGTVQATNSWLSPFSVTTSDFISMDFNQAYADRKLNGSLPDITTMHLASGSDLINTGTDVGLPFIGSKPDLGYRESSITTATEIELAMEAGFGIYPNPSNGKFTLRGPNLGNSAVKIFNQMGAKVAEMSLDANGTTFDLDLSNEAPGLYILHLAGQNHTSSHSVMIK